jgi:hypothetical protein
MTRYAVIVRDECSEAITTVEIEAERREDARVQALNKTFRELGGGGSAPASSMWKKWRRAHEPTASRGAG